MDRSDPKAEIWPVTGEEPSWNLITAMADDAIDWMYRIHQTDPDQPIFLYYVPGASHAPHHPTKEWVDKIHAMHLFDDGYEKLRETIFANQQKLGVIPQGPGADTLARRSPDAHGTSSRPRRRSSSSARWRCSLPTWPTTITRSAV